MSSQKRPGSIGDRELALLQFVAGRGDATVAEAVEGFGAPRGLARSTVLTMMERLRSKGLLDRAQVDGVFRYRPATAPEIVERGMVGSFIERTLAGSFSPLVAYLAEEAEVSAADLAELEELVATLQAKASRGSR